MKVAFHKNHFFRGPSGRPYQAVGGSPLVISKEEIAHIDPADYAVLEDDQAPQPPTGDGLDAKTIAQLKEFAAEQQPPIIVPEDVKKKDDILAFIRAEIAKKAGPPAGAATQPQ